jgi:hypothetical protein
LSFWRRAVIETGGRGGRRARRCRAPTGVGRDGVDASVAPSPFLHIVLILKALPAAVSYKLRKDVILTGLREQGFLGSARAEGCGG